MIEVDAVIIGKYCDGAVLVIEQHHLLLLNGCLNPGVGRAAAEEVVDFWQHAYSPRLLAVHSASKSAVISRPCSEAMMTG